jgi:hypothetical protein
VDSLQLARSSRRHGGFRPRARGKVVAGAEAAFSLVRSLARERKKSSRRRPRCLRSRLTLPARGCPTQRRPSTPLGRVPSPASASRNKKNGRTHGDVMSVCQLYPFWRSAAYFRLESNQNEIKAACHETTRSISSLCCPFA